MLFPCAFTNLSGILAANPNSPVATRVSQGDDLLLTLSHLVSLIKIVRSEQAQGWHQQDGII